MFLFAQASFFTVYYIYYYLIYQNLILRSPFQIMNLAGLHQYVITFHISKILLFSEYVFNIIKSIIQTKIQIVSNQRWFMQIINQIGHIQHWGLTPAINFLQHYKQNQPHGKIKVLLTGTSDIRHILKTLCDINNQKNVNATKIQIYFHETQKQLLCRALLFLHIIHEINLNFQERIQLFLDLYGNALVKQRNSRYLSNLRLDLLNLIHDQKNVKTPIKKFVNLKLLKFEQRDEMSQIINSWSEKVDFDIVKLRDQRLRYMFKQRYDYRANLVDWDYSMLLTEYAPIIHFYHYKQWRLTGLAFEQRFSTYTQPNRTLASYVPGKKKQERTSCVVRGYWGDMMISPYIAMGIDTNSKQKQLLFKKANMKYVGHSVELAEYNIQYWLQRIQTQTTYEKYFRDYYRTDEQGKKALQEKQQSKKKKKQKKIKNQNQLQEIKEEEENDKQQTHQEQSKQNKKQNEQQIVEKKQLSKEDEDLDSQEQERKQKLNKKNAQDIKFTNESDAKILKLFQKYGVQFYPFSMPIQNITKGKFKQFFDVIVCGFIHSAYLTKQRYLQSTLKKGGHLYVETAQYIVPKKKQQRKQLYDKLKVLAVQKPIKQGQIAAKDLQLVQDNKDHILFLKSV